MKKTELLGQIMTEREVAAETRVAAGTLRYWRATGRGPRWFRLGDRKVGYLRDDVETWTAGQYDASA
jgi:predicted DNA-binding transcriptional regulator AlpA